jgi:hypothetical protein
MTMEARPETARRRMEDQLSGETFASAPKTRAPTQQLCGYSLATPYAIGQRGITSRSTLRRGRAGSLA